MTKSSSRLIERISPAYLTEQRRLHADPRGYGTKGRKWLGYVKTLAVDYGCATILDYGCGGNSLITALSREVFPGDPPKLRAYDPAIEAFSKEPQPADLVVCTDALEHVEPDKVDAVLDHLQALTVKVLFVVVALVPTAKTLSNGDQAHVSLHPADWWRSKLMERFILFEQYGVKPDKQWCAVFLNKEV